MTEPATTTDLERLQHRLDLALATARRQRRALADLNTNLETITDLIDYLLAELDDAAASEELYRRTLLEVTALLADATTDADLPQVLHQILTTALAPLETSATRDGRRCTHPHQDEQSPCPRCGHHNDQCSCLACSTDDHTIGSAA